MFHWHGEAPTEAASLAFAEEATNALVAIAERHGCLLGGGFADREAPCESCAEPVESSDTACD